MSGKHKFPTSGKRKIGASSPPDLDHDQLQPEGEQVSSETSNRSRPDVEIPPLEEWPSLAEYSDRALPPKPSASPAGRSSRPAGGATSKPSASPARKNTNGAGPTTKPSGSSTAKSANVAGRSTKPTLLHPYEVDGRNLMAGRQQRPRSKHGWRKMIAKVTAGRINPGPSPKEKHAAEVVSRIRASLDRVHKIAFVSAKGGVGKSTMTVTLGNLTARIRGDRVIAVDVDPDLGDLSSRFSERRGPNANIEQVAALNNAERYSTVRMHTVVNNDRLELLGAQNDPRSSYVLGTAGYLATMRILEMHCNVILLDCGSSITKPLFRTIAGDVDTLVVVASQDVRGVEGALATLDWLKDNGFARLLSHTVVALNATREGKPPVDLQIVEDQFKKLVPDVFRVPYDPHLAEGLAVDLPAVKPKTRKALLELAGGVARHYRSSRVRPRYEDDLATWNEIVR